MTQRHVDLLLKALSTPESYSKYLCVRIGFITGIYEDYPELIEDEYHDIIARHGIDLWVMINQNIDYKHSFADTQYAKDGMTREQWVFDILIPLARELP